MNRVAFTMRAHHFTTFGAVLLLSTTAWSQTLADVAKREEERRKNLPEAAKVYTNKDLTPAPAPQSPPSPSKDTGDAKDAKDDKDSKGAVDKDKDKDKDGKDVVKDKAYWSGRLKALQDQVSQNETFIDALQTRVNSLTTDFVNRDDPAQRSVIEQNRQKAVTELARLKQAVVDGKKAIANLEEEARRAGVPPGWLR
jgi:hypothetical protein